ncbi:MAG: PepSY-associated TM helix domain-containing protein [Pseudomonadota bacterium]
MKNETIKTFLDIHTWTGLGAGMALFIAFYAGAITVFTHELQHWESHERGAAAISPQSMEDAQRLLEAALTAEPGASESFRLALATAAEPRHLGRWFERKEDGEFERHEFRLDDDGLLSTEQDRSNLANFVYRLHYTAGLPNRLGLYTLGVICVIYGLALVSGIVLFAPNFLKDLFIVRPGANKKRFWLDAHNVVGVISLPWHVVFAWSSAILAIGVFFLAPFQILVFENDLIESVGPELGALPPIEASGEAAAPLDVDALITRAEEALPSFEASQLRFEHLGDTEGRVSIFGAVNANTLVEDASVTLSLTNGEVINVFDPAQATPGATFYRGLIALHFVDFGGEFIRWVYFLLSMGGAFLFFSGNLLYVETRRKRRRREQPSRTIFMARLNSGVCIGCMAGISAAFIATRFFANFDDRALLTELTYYLTFALAVVWAFVRPVAAGTRDLLLACAALSAAIPVIDAVLVGMPLWRSAANGEWTFLVVDGLAALFAVAFWRMAWATDKRARRGDPNSVWSLDHRTGSGVAVSQAAAIGLPD